jgi:large subunit ribosomal protein L31
MRDMRHRFLNCGGEPILFPPSNRILGSPVPEGAGPKTTRGKIMKPEIHPEYKETQVTCGCGEKFVTRSTVASGSIYVEVCSVCHPFYTGKQRILDTGGRVAKFEERFGKKSAN